MPTSFILLYLFVNAVDGVGLKRRLAEHDQPPEGDDESLRAGDRRIGGHRQRIARAVADETESNPGSGSPAEFRLPLNQALKVRWAKGKISSKDVQDISMGAMQQGASGCDRVANMGSAGRHAQNIFRSMRSALGMPRGAPEMDWFEIPMRSGRKTPHPFLLPHKFFSSFYSECIGKWASKMSGPPGACRQFWNGMRDSSFLRLHPNLPEASWPRSIPLGVHADAGAFSEQDSLYTISWNSLLGDGPTVRKRFVFTVLRKNDMVADSLDCALKILAWSMNALSTGAHPVRDPWNRAIPCGGNNLAGYWRALLCQCRGDWAFFKECFYFPQWNAAERMCFVCRASSTIRALSWTNCNADAPWRHTVWTHESYMTFLREGGFAVPVLLSQVVGFRLECIMIDILHTVDLGVAAHIIGNVLFIFCVLRGCFGGATYADRVKRLATDLANWYKETKCTGRLRGELKLEDIRKSGCWPKLRGKAAAIRHMAGYALKVVRAFGNGSVHDNRVRAVCELLCRFYEIVSQESQFCSEDAKREMPVLGQLLAELYAQLSHDALHRGERLWKMSPKLHLREHLCEIQCVLAGNPRYWWCYADEDLVGHMVDIAEGCHPATMAYSVLFKWLHCYFEDE